MAAEQLEVIVVEDHLAMRKGIELLLRGEGLRVVGVASQVSEERALLARRRHDVALIDVCLGSENAVGLVEALLRRDPEAAIVLNTGYTDPDSGLADVVRAGARGFVLKSSPARDRADPHPQWRHEAGRHDAGTGGGDDRAQPRRAVRRRPWSAYANARRTRASSVGAVTGFSIRSMSSKSIDSSRNGSANPDM